MLDARVGDMTIGVGSHGNKCCSHLLVGIFITGAPTVLTNGPPQVRFGDFTVHNCPHCPVGMAIMGSPTVLSSGAMNHRLGDMVLEFCGVGMTISGSATCLSGA